MKKAGTLMRGILAVTMMIIMLGTSNCKTVQARTTNILNSNDVGVGNLLNPTEVAEVSDEERAKAHDVAEDINDKAAEDAEDEEEQEQEEEDSSKLVMANVNQVMNIRISPDDSSEKVGVLYKDCGGKIIEQKDGWTKLQSGDLVGWANDEYLLFDEEAEELAEEVGVQLVTSNCDALRIRAEADENAEVLGVITNNSFVDMVEDLGNGWIAVDYNDETGYVQAEYVDTDFRIDEGETMAAIQKREEEEAKRKAEEEAKKAKAKLTQNTGAVSAGADEARLLAALIYCEAGNQSYEGKVAVGAVVMNRVKSSAYASTISGVIYASGQFTPALNGTVDRVYAGNIPDSCVQAAQAALAGETTCGTALHFRRAGGHDGQIIGAHVFW
ncbi:MULTISPECIES: cell wall hydrolase [unclassified Butyrivibrio]|uniref:cell wall hydrolase n=1 Tax=unclassified Butyrivibrio TaxID=2639466 RepID=UPI0003B41D82|nr:MULTISPECIES: cell wall hydrolase [unclassified Butyrivibrio]